MDQSHIRNFCIIAHIDHGKSTLSDRLLERTGTLAAREMTEQVLDQMDLERERGITIKAKAVRMAYTAPDGQTYQLNLIDTPGHVDFTYEVSRALAACEGALLVVDASQGVEAQTIANLYLALDHNLAIVPVINKIDLASAQPDQVAHDLRDLLGIDEAENLYTSAKTGSGVDEVLEAIVTRVPAPSGDPQAPLRALVFDSHYDPYKGVVAYVRVVDGQLNKRTNLMFMSHHRIVEVLELGVFRPKMTPVETLSAGEVGYVATGLKDVKECRVGDTLTDVSPAAAQALPGYRPAKPMVFAGLYPVEGPDYALLRDALDKLSLNDASFTYEPESSVALGFGFRCGFLGLLHMEIVQERLEREYDLNIIATAPSVEYHVLTHDGVETRVDNPSQLPAPETIEEIREPWMRITVICPARHIGPVMELVTVRRGEYERMEYLDEQRVLLNYQIPLSELIIDFYDQLKSRTQGYASLDYVLLGYQPGELVKMDILVNELPVDALSLIVHQDIVQSRGQALTRRMKKVIPRQQFAVPIQAAVGGRIVARQTVKALRKNVLAKCYGGDITRKRKLLEKQKAGKKRMKRFGNVEIPQDAFMAVLRLDEEED
ncbi:MAG: translation elongation factor 4 [Chloroflexi bacterium]|nr:translation elongation factor 4 [Chloroflexota bacterium]MBU1750123.1 translation elongation factor 4 [Chloroflexota bacterium]